MPIKSFITRSAVCSECDRKFSGRDPKTVDKLMKIHYSKAHGITNVTPERREIIHENCKVVKLLTDQDLKTTSDDATKIYRHIETSK